MYRILVPDYFGQQVLSGVRALSRAGSKVQLAYKVGALSRTLFRSRHIERFIDIASSSDNVDAYINDLANLTSNNHYDCLIPFGLSSYHALVLHQEKLQNKTAFMLPPREAFEIANDKGRTATLCKEIGVSVPETFTDVDEADVRHIANNVRYPVVIKARSGTGVQNGLRYANNRDELLEKYAEITSQRSHDSFVFDKPIIQEFIPGFIHDACTLTREGRVVCVLTQVRQLMYPIYGGVGAVNITTQDERLKALASKVLEALNWNGPAQVEFKYDARDNTYKLIEVNPKLWGTLDLSIKAGCNFPVMIRDLCCDNKLPQNTDYKAGVRYIFGYAQAFWARRQLRATAFTEADLQFWPITETFYDLDADDIMPDLHRRISVLFSYLRGHRGTSVTSNINFDAVLGLNP
jgi:predicted ATP-grasp superfamily ATP-dependent carboligase